MGWVPLSDFGKGLNLSSGPLDTAYALDCLDVTYGRTIRTRPGFTYLTDTEEAYTKLHGWKNTTGSKYLLAARSGNTDALDSGGDAAYTTAKTFTDAVSFGSPGNEVAYLANGSDAVFKFSGTAFSSPTNMPKAKYLAVQSPDNRLVATGFTAGANGPSGVTVSESTVHFSDEGAPETWSANNYVHLTPGDGEKITGVTSWRNLVIAFKETKFFVFTGNGEGVDGNPEFIYRQVDGAGLVAPNAIAIAPEGVYFLARDGIYFTNGGNPERILEQEMGPIFENKAPPFFSSQNVNQTYASGAAATFYKGRAYFAVPMGAATTNSRIIVYDRAFGWWSVYSLTANDLTVWNPSSDDEILFAHPQGEIARHSEAETTDAGDPILSFSRQAWLDAGQRMSVRQFKVWGDGLVSCSAATDYSFAAGPTVTADLRSTATPWGSGDPDDAPWGDGSSSDWTWGPEGTYRHKTVRGLASRGFVFSFIFANTSTPTPMVIEQASVQLLGGVNPEQ